MQIDAKKVELEWPMIFKPETRKEMVEKIRAVRKEVATLESLIEEV